MIRSYSDLAKLKTFEERFQYLRLNGSVGKETFGFDRVLNQRFYTSQIWRSMRDRVIIRDSGCDLGAEGHTIYGKVLIHHMNPVSLDDIMKQSDFLLNPEYLILTCHATHNAIHYGDENLLVTAPLERKPNDTCPWKR